MDGYTALSSSSTNWTLEWDKWDNGKISANQIFSWLFSENNLKWILKNCHKFYVTLSGWILWEQECSNSLKEAIVRLVITGKQYTRPLLEILACTCNAEWNDMCIIVFSHAENIPQSDTRKFGWNFRSLLQQNIYVVQKPVCLQHWSQVCARVRIRVLTIAEHLLHVFWYNKHCYYCDTSTKGHFSWLIVLI